MPKQQPPLPKSKIGCAGLHSHQPSHNLRLQY
jgi:hypothetical protein